MKKDAPAGKSRPNIKGSSKEQIQIQPKVIPLITITDSQEGISIRYAPSLITKNAVGQILQWIENRTGRHYDYTLPERQTPLLIFLPDVHHAEKLFTGFTNNNLKNAKELVTEYLDKINVNELNAVIVKEIEGKEIKAPPPLLGLHQELEKAEAYDQLKAMRWRKSHKDDDPEKRVRVLQEYLMTEKPMGDLIDTAGVTSVDGVSRIVHRNLNKIFQFLPPDVQQRYGGSADEAIKRKADAQLQTDVSSERIKKGIEGRVYTKPTGRPKGRKDSQPRKSRELSNTHKQRISDSLTRPHQELRIQQQILPHEEQTIVDFQEN